MISRILWDLGNVVILADHVITHARLASIGVRPARARRFYTIDAYADFARGRLSGLEFYEDLNAAMETQLSIETLVEAHDAHMWGIDDDVVFLMRHVNRPLVFATDTNEWQTRRERELIDVREFSDVVFRSNELKMLKRDPGCFASIVVQLGDEPGRLLLIDDSPEKIAQADALGLQTIRYESADQLAFQLMQRKLLT